MSQIKTYYRGKNEVEEVYTLKTTTFTVNKDGVAVATFNMPKRLNPLTVDLIWEILLIAEHAKRDSQVKILVWTGNGRAFSSGASFGGKCTVDIEIQRGYNENQVGHMAPPGQPDRVLKGIVMAMLNFPKVSICAVNGLTVGGSVNFALAGLHDLVYVAESAKFKFPFTELGITPEVFSSYMMPRAMGLVTAKEIFFTCRWFSSHEAKQFGLANEVIPDDKLMEKVMDVATKLSSSSQTSLRLTKRLINSHLLEPKNASETMDEENRIIAKAMGSPDFQKAMLAFMARHSKPSKKSKL